MGFFPPSFAFFSGADKSHCCWLREGELAGEAEQGSGGWGDKARGCTSLCSAARFAPACAPTGRAAITGISRVIAVQTEIRGQLRS